MSVFFAPTQASEGAQDEQQELPESRGPRASVLHALAAAIFQVQGKTSALVARERA